MFFVCFRMLYVVYMCCCNEFKIFLVTAGRSRSEHTGRKMLLNFIDLLLKVKTFENIKLKVKFALNNKTFFNTETVYFLTIFLFFFLSVQSLKKQ